MAVAVITPSKLKVITPEEFVSKILSGERDFAGIKLPYGASLELPNYEVLIDYLKNNAFISKKDRYIFDGSEMKSLYAPRIYLPFSSAKGLDLSGARLRGACFASSDFTDASARNACLGDASIKDSIVDGMDLGGAYLAGADLRGTDIQNAKYAEHATFYRTKITQGQQAFLESQLAKRLFEIS